MDGNNFDGDGRPPGPPPQAPPSPQAVPLPHAGPAPQAPQPQGVPHQQAPGPVSQPQGAEQPWAAPTNWAPPPAGAATKKPRSKLLLVLVGLAVLSVGSILFVAVAIVLATSTGVFDSDETDGSASSPLDQPVVAAEADGTGTDSDEAESEIGGASDQPVAAAPVAPEGVTITWDASPSACDGNNKRSFSANVGNAAPQALDVRVRILDSGNNFVHQSHVYTVPASGEAHVDLGGIPAGQSIVQLVTEADDRAIDQTDVNFETC